MLHESSIVIIGAVPCWLFLLLNNGCALAPMEIDSVAEGWLWVWFVVIRSQRLKLPGFGLSEGHA
jgi:hypothetical protein